MADDGQLFSEEEESSSELADENVSELSGKSFGRGRDLNRPKQLWLISYADFMTVLMIFFLAMYGYATMAKASLMKAQRHSYGEFVETIQKMQGRLGSEIQIQEDVNKVTVELEEKILFGSGSASLTPSAARTIAELANSIKLVEGDVIIEGHTDNVPIAGGAYKSNWELSAARAYSVIDALSRQGIDPTRLAAWGFGENRPVASNEDMLGRARNRRIEVVLLKKTVKGH